MVPSQKQQMEKATTLSIGIQVHASVGIYGDVYLGEPARIFANALLDRVTIGAFSYISNRSVFHNTTVGRYCSIGDNVATLSNHPLSSLTTSPFPYESIFKKPFDVPPQHEFEKTPKITIGNDVWVGSGVKILPGVTIGDGAIIGTGAIVTKDIAPYTVIAGVPGKPIKTRFSKETIARLLELKWWDYDVVGKKISWTSPADALVTLEHEISSGAFSLLQSRWFKITRKQDGIHGDMIPDPTEV
ncbi:CatB-related O-acetyltransferase [Pseudophaeobacter sp.]|uniref:CatB-related O-acetyltransferase n=1 Tax=Pseudophaeobacter sp. TaxID=1971739 RepID=UPI0032977A98